MCENARRAARVFAPARYEELLLVRFTGSADGRDDAAPNRGQGFQEALFLDNRLDNRQEISGSDLLLVFYFQVVAEIRGGGHFKPLKLVRLPFRHFRVARVESCLPRATFRKAVEWVTDPILVAARAAESSPAESSLAESSPPAPVRSAP